MSSNTIVVDASGLRLGRAASVIAKKLLEGKKVIVVNSEKAVISGSRQAVIERYKRRMERRTWKNPEKVGPKRERRPDGLFYAAVKGMLPRKTPRGKEALSRLRVFIGIPPEYEKMEKITIPEASLEKLKGPYITLMELSRELGWNPPKGVSL
ncbi:MAG: 50S ribosomal protein L13 [Candidatus Methanomethylicota archaeon]|uniref:Large ribosomal subunit protein uL13 n=1 Tax=Thermoproteota archaeon TaxID=2056631 RepID=A0A497EZ44_9CREN|nr:MAG: 50S ribosomal protein L13 [Candidatus Verstraetearchaeota archaeon]RLE52475.1 MAG: 50S ribosomal protein L13 [Candidatus Verstraetearchaeota archaeon]